MKYSDPQLDFVNANYSNPLFDQKLEMATDGLEPYYIDHLKTMLSRDNAWTIANYV